MSLFGTIRAFLLGVISAVVFACGGENFDKIRNIDSAGETIICFGDSLTEGVGAAEGEDYPTVLSRLLGVAGRQCGTPQQLVSTR
jgi:acyl-CoA hydrolase